MYMGDSIVEVLKCSYGAQFENCTPIHWAYFFKRLIVWYSDCREL